MKLNNKKGFYMFWIWRICLILTFEVENDKLFDFWIASKGYLVVIGKFGIGIGCK